MPNKPIDNTKFDVMNSEELEEYLRADFQRSESEQSNPDELLYISELLAKRQESDVDWESDISRAWSDFNKYYRSENRENAGKQAVPARLHLRRLLRVAAVAAVLAVLLFATTVIASAQGIDIWASLSNWTMETFGFSFFEQPHKDDILLYHHVPEQLSELADYLEVYGAGNHVIPSYLPKNTQVMETKLFSNDRYTKITCVLSGEDDRFVIQYYLFDEPMQGIDYEKDNIQPEIYMSNGITYYISLNMDEYQCAWAHENIECSITGLHSRDELLKIIDSIPGE